MLNNMDSDKIPVVGACVFCVRRPAVLSGRFRTLFSAAVDSVYRRYSQCYPTVCGPSLEAVPAESRSLDHLAISSFGRSHLHHGLCCVSTPGSQSGLVLLGHLYDFKVEVGEQQTLCSYLMGPLRITLKHCVIFKARSCYSLRACVF